MPSTLLWKVKKPLNISSRVRMANIHLVMVEATSPAMARESRLVLNFMMH